MRVLQQGFWLALLLSVPGVLFLTHPGVVLGMAGNGGGGRKQGQVVSCSACLESAGFALLSNFLCLLQCTGPAAGADGDRAGRACPCTPFWPGGLPCRAGWVGRTRGCRLRLVQYRDCLGGLSGSRRISRLRAAGGALPPVSPTGKCRTGKPGGSCCALVLPMGFSNLVEITAFTLIALFVAPLGAEVVAGHRIVANLAALCYMLPLSLAIATLSAVGQAVGARDWPRAHAVIGAGLLLAAGLSTLLGVLLWLAAVPLVAAYTDDPGVRAVAMSLVAYIALYQFFDALQTVAGHVLRAYRVTFVPMLIQTSVSGVSVCGVAGGGVIAPRLRSASTASGSARWSAWCVLRSCWGRCYGRRFEARNRRRNYEFWPAMIFAVCGNILSPRRYNRAGSGGNSATAHCSQLN